MTPLAPERFGLQVTLDQETHDLLKRAQALMSHQNPGGEIAPVLKRALQALVGQLEKQKFAATDRPRGGEGSAGNGGDGPSSRHVSASTKRRVWERDQGRCTFVSENGKRCDERALVEFDHKDLWARGGEATPDRMRLRCRAHNQHAAERELGADFMERKRREAQSSRRRR